MDNSLNNVDNLEENVDNFKDGKDSTFLQTHQQYIAGIKIMSIAMKNSPKEVQLVIYAGHMHPKAIEQLLRLEQSGPLDMILRNPQYKLFDVGHIDVNTGEIKNADTASVANE